MSALTFPMDVVFRNELLRSGKNLSPINSQEEFDARKADYEKQALRLRKFAVWVGIMRGQKEVEIARGQG